MRRAEGSAGTQRGLNEGSSWVQRGFCKMVVFIKKRLCKIENTEKMKAPKNEGAKMKAPK